MGIGGIGMVGGVASVGAVGAAPVAAAEVTPGVVNFRTITLVVACRQAAINIGPSQD